MSHTILRALERALLQTDSVSLFARLFLDDGQTDRRIVDADHCDSCRNANGYATCDVMSMP